MTLDLVESGVVHEVPSDLKDLLMTSKVLVDAWNDLTPLARNEWICWVTLVKRVETRQNHIERLRKEILEGKRRPCCWPGCPHYNPKAKKWLK